MAMSKTITITFGSSIRRNELEEFLREVPPGVAIHYDHYAGDMREPPTLTLRATLPMTSRSSEPSGPNQTH